jgi:hypothetical protein
MEAVQKRQRVIPAWRLAGGIFLHFTVPAYLLTLAIAGMSAALQRRPLAAMLGNIVHLSGWFLLGYSLLGIVSVTGLALGEYLIDRWRSPPSPPPVRQSRARLDRALGIARQTFGNAAEPLLRTFTANPSDHADPRIQALTADLVELVDRTTTALASAPLDRSEPIVALGLQSLAHIAASFEALATERSRLDEGDVRVIARYVETRYGPSDSASSG